LLPLGAHFALAANPRQDPSHEVPLRKTPDGVATLRPLAVVGFRGEEELDPRDVWMPLAIEETLARRLRRVPTLIVIPTTRTHQARQELAENEKDAPVAWPRVVHLLGAKLWLRGTCVGTPHALTLNLELIRMGDSDDKPATTQLGPGRLFDVIDEATQWTLGCLNVTPIDTATEKIAFAPPAKSPSALEYYAKALSSARRENLRDGAFYVERAVGYDPTYRPALMLMAKIALRGSAATRARAKPLLARTKQLATQNGDMLDQAESQLTQGLLLMSTRSFDLARQRFESEHASAIERNDIYGEIAALNCLGDLWLSYRPPARAELPDDERRRLRRQSLRRAAESQLCVLEALSRLGDVIAEVPAASKLALIYEELEEPERALEAHQRTLAAANKTGSLRNQATGWLLLGKWYRKHERQQEAREAMTRCLELVPEHAKPATRIILAEVCRGMSLSREALEQYQAAYEATKASYDDTGLMNQFLCLRGIAELRMEQGHRKDAIQALQEALDIAEVQKLTEENAIRQQLAEWKRAKP
jgi:tetratricopeptide (TPR) repeat protein